MSRITSVTRPNFRPWYNCTAFPALKDERRCKIRGGISGTAPPSAQHRPLVSALPPPVLCSNHRPQLSQPRVGPHCWSGYPGRAWREKTPLVFRHWPAVGSAQHSCSQWRWPTGALRARPVRHSKSEWGLLLSAGEKLLWADCHVGVNPRECSPNPIVRNAK